MLTGRNALFYITRNKEEALSVPRTVYLFGTDLRIPIDSYRSHFVSVSVFQKMAGQNARYIDSKKRDAGVFGFPEIKGIVSRNTRDEIKTMELRPGGLGGGGSFYIVDANVYFNDVGWACGVEASAPKISIGNSGKFFTNSSMTNAIRYNPQNSGILFHLFY